MVFSRLKAAGRKLCLCLFVLLWEDLGSGSALVIAIAPTQELSIVLAISLYMFSAISTTLITNCFRVAAIPNFKPRGET